MAEVKYKILAPKIAKDLEGLIFDNNEVKDNDSFCDGIMEGCILENQRAERVSFDRVIFRNVIFKEAAFKSLELTDIRFENCDLSNADLSGSVIHRVEMVKCKILGLNLSEATLRNVLFDDCNGLYISFRFSDCKQVNFKNCLLNNGDFQKSNFSKVSFLSSNLQQVEFSGTTLKGIDLTSSEIDGMGARIEDLNGVIVSTEQAASLSRLMGVIVKI